MSERGVYEAIWARKMAGQNEFRPVDRWAVAASEFEPVDRLLDIGCGDGRASLCVRGRVGALVATDISVEACRAATGNGLRAVPASLNDAFLPFVSGRFDAVTCLDVIEHVFDPVHVMAEIARVLRRGGRAYVSTVNMRYVKFVWSLLVRGVFPATSSDREMYDGGHLHYFAATNIQRLGREVGLVPVRHIGVVPSARLRALQPLRRWWPVRQFLAAGFLLIFEKP
jgi:SAM-dependent methyltransferase